MSKVLPLFLIFLILAISPVDIFMQNVSAALPFSDGFEDSTVGHRPESWEWSDDLNDGNITTSSVNVHTGFYSVYANSYSDPNDKAYCQKDLSAETITEAAWYMNCSVYIQDTNVDQFIFGLVSCNYTDAETPVVPDDYCLIYIESSNDTWAFGWKDDGGLSSYEYSAKSVVYDTWHNVTLTGTTNGTVKLWVDGYLYMAKATSDHTGDTDDLEWPTLGEWSGAATCDCYFDDVEVGATYLNDITGGGAPPGASGTWPALTDFEDGTLGQCPLNWTKTEASGGNVTTSSAYAYSGTKSVVVDTSGGTGEIAYIYNSTYDNLTEYAWQMSVYCYIYGNVVSRPIYLFAIADGYGPGGPENMIYATVDSDGYYGIIWKDDGGINHPVSSGHAADYNTWVNVTITGQEDGNVWMGVDDVEFLNVDIGSHTGDCDSFEYLVIGEYSSSAIQIVYYDDVYVDNSTYTFTGGTTYTNPYYVVGTSIMCGHPYWDPDHTIACTTQQNQPVYWTDRYETMSLEGYNFSEWESNATQCSGWDAYVLAEGSGNNPIDEHSGVLLGTDGTGTWRVPYDLSEVEVLVHDHHHEVGAGYTLAQTQAYAAAFGSWVTANMPNCVVYTIGFCPDSSSAIRRTFTREMARWWDSYCDSHDNFVFVNLTDFSLGLTTTDIWTTDTWDCSGTGYFQSDDIHLTQAGAQLVGYTIAQYILGTPPSPPECPDPPSDFAGEVLDDNNIMLTWVRDQGNSTVIRRSTSSYPTTPQSDTGVYNGTLESYYDINLAYSTSYYYTAWSYDTISHNFSIYSTKLLVTTNASASSEDPDPPNYFTGTLISDTSVRLTWVKDSGNNTVIRGLKDVSPTGPTSGYSVYNGSGQTVDDTGLDTGSHYFYRAWTYDTATGNFSSVYRDFDIWTTFPSSPGGYGIDYYCDNGSIHLRQGWNFIALLYDNDSWDMLSEVYQNVQSAVGCSETVGIWLSTVQDYWQYPSDDTPIYYRVGYDNWGFMVYADSAGYVKYGGNRVGQWQYKIRASYESIVWSSLGWHYNYPIYAEDLCNMLYGVEAIAWYNTSAAGWEMHPAGVSSSNFLVYPGTAVLVKLEPDIDSYSFTSAGLQGVEHEIIDTYDSVAYDFKPVNGTEYNITEGQKVNLRLRVYDIDSNSVTVDIYASFNNTTSSQVYHRVLYDTKVAKYIDVPIDFKGSVGDCGMVNWSVILVDSYGNVVTYPSSGTYFFNITYVESVGYGIDVFFEQSFPMDSFNAWLVVAAIVLSLMFVPMVFGYGFGLFNILLGLVGMLISSGLHLVGYAAVFGIIGLFAIAIVGKKIL